MANTVDGWDLFTDKEREILHEKIKLQDGEKTLSDAFNRVIRIYENDDVAESVMAIRNMMDVLGAHKKSRVWNEIELINQTFPKQGNLLEIHVKTRGSFMVAVSNERDNAGRYKYVVNDFWDKKFGHHGFDTIRQQTEFSTDYAIHLANDNAANLRAYFIHFDPASSYFRTATHGGAESFFGKMPFMKHMNEIRWAAAQHGKVGLTQSQIRQFLKDTGQASEA